MKLLFIDHECHRKTGSTAFFLEDGPRVVKECQE